MLIAPCVLVTLLAGGTQPPMPAPPTGLTLQPSVATTGLTFSTADQGSSSSSSSSSSSNGPLAHEVGFGGMVGSINLGTGLDVKYWFMKYVGVDMRLLMSSANQLAGVTQSPGGFSFDAAPSVVAMFTKPDTSKPVVFRPYFGAGVNHTRAGSNLTNTGGPVSGSGLQFFGGVEAQLEAVHGLALGFEVDYNKRSQTLVTAGVKSGTTAEILILVYVK